MPNCFVSIFMPRWAPSDMKTTRDYLILCSFFFGPLVFSSETLALPKALCQDLPVNLSSFLLGHHSRTSFWICSFQSSWAWFSFTEFIFSLSGSFFWTLSCSFTPSWFFPPVNSSWIYRLAFNCSLVILLSLVLSFSKLYVNTLSAKN